MENIREYKSNKAEEALPGDDISLGDVERDIQDIQSYITSLKSGEEGSVEDAIKGASLSKFRPKTPYSSENFESNQERDELLLDFPKGNNQVEDIRDSILKDYYRNLAPMNADEDLESGILINGNGDDRRVQDNLPDERRRLGLRRLPDNPVSFQYPEQILERKGGKLSDATFTNIIEPSSKTQGHASYSTSRTSKRHRNKHINAQRERNLQLHATKKVNGTKLITEKKIPNSREDPKLKVSQKHGDSVKSGNVPPPRKGHKSKHAGLTASSHVAIQEHIDDKNLPDRIDDAKKIENNRHKSRMRQNSHSLAKHQTHKHTADSVKDAATLAIDGSMEHKNIVSVQKRRGQTARYRQKYIYHRRPQPKPYRPPPQRPYQPPPTRPTTTTEMITTTKTTERTTWTTQPPATRTMQEIVDSGVEKIDVPLTDSNTWHAIIHGRRDIVLAGAIMGGIGLLLIILSFVYMFVNRRKNQQKMAGNATTTNNKSYQKLGSEEETAKLTEPEHSLFPLSSDEDTSGESDTDSAHPLIETTKTVR